MGQKSAQLPCFERVKQVNKKSRVKNFFAVVNKAVAKVNLCEKILGACATFSPLLSLIPPSVQGKTSVRIDAYPNVYRNSFQTASGHWMRRNISQRQCKIQVHFVSL